jgi:hypothetical protein
MTLDPAQLPDDIATLKAMVIAGGREIEALKLTIAKLRRDKFGTSSERGARLFDQLELQLAELEERASQDMATAALKAPPTTDQERLRPARRVLPQHLPRERVVHATPSSCPGCGGALRKLGEDISEDRVPGCGVRGPVMACARRWLGPPVRPPRCGAAGPVDHR